MFSFQSSTRFHTWRAIRTLYKPNLHHRLPIHNLYILHFPRHPLGLLTNSPVKQRFVGERYTSLEIKKTTGNLHAAHVSSAFFSYSLINVTTENKPEKHQSRRSRPKFETTYLVRYTFLHLLKYLFILYQNTSLSLIIMNSIMGSGWVGTFCSNLWFYLFIYFITNKSL
ncbi:hypothetical protein Hdeb2414_s0006g00195311 [Helianthus debilis subsp. tardiflorus]